MRRRLDLKVVGPYGVALIVCTIFYLQALEIAPAPGHQLGPAVWPKTILLFAMLTCIWEIGRSIINETRKSGTASAGTANDASHTASADSAYDDSTGVKRYTPWLGIGLTVLYVAAFPWLGYPLATFLYVAAFVYFGNYRHPVAAMCIGLVSSLVFMFLFMRVVYVSLPIGVDPFSQVSTLLMHVMGIK